MGAQTLGSLVSRLGRRPLLYETVWIPSGTLSVAIIMKLCLRAAQCGDNARLEY